jgi:hypothetical protein
MFNAFKKNIIGSQRYPRICENKYAGIESVDLESRCLKGGVTMKQERSTSHFIIAVAIFLTLLASLLVGCGTQRALVKKEAQALSIEPQRIPE